MDEMNKPLVSIVIPYYNKKDTINRCIQSVLNQTFTNWELILVDDNGEEPLEWNEHWNSYPIEVLTNPKNLGAAQSRQLGQEMAKGQYIAFLDADDWWGEQFLDVCVNGLENDHSVAGAYVKTKVYFDKGLNNFRRYSQLGLTRIRETLIQYAKPWQTGGIVWKKECCTSWGNLKTHEDSWFEFLNSRLSNELMYLEDEIYHHDETGSNHLSVYNGNEHSTVDQQELFLMVFREFWSLLSFKYKIILYHRLIRGQLKIHEYYPEKAAEMGEKLVKLSPYLFSIRSNTLALKLIHKVLQKSPFKIYY
jgi:glycosyltransferase involved in cell wall biosynthesis